MPFSRRRANKYKNMFFYIAWTTLYISCIIVSGYALDFQCKPCAFECIVNYGWLCTDKWVSSAFKSHRVSYHVTIIELSFWTETPLPVCIFIIYFEVIQLVVIVGQNCCKTLNHFVYSDNVFWFNCLFYACVIPIFFSLFMWRTKSHFTFPIRPRWSY